MSQEDSEQFAQLAIALARSPYPLVRVAALRLLGFYGRKDDKVAQDVAENNLGDAQTREEALRALGRVGTETAFAIVLTYAQEGNLRALWAAAEQARTKQQRDDIIQLARQFLLSNEVHLRMQALRCLRALSTIQADEDLLLKAAEQHPDELIFAAMRTASPAILPGLRRLRDRFPKGSAEYLDITDTIERVEARASAS